MHGQPRETNQPIKTQPANQSANQRARDKQGEKTWDDDTDKEGDQKRFHLLLYIRKKSFEKKMTPKEKAACPGITLPCSMLYIDDKHVLLFVVMV